MARKYNKHVIDHPGETVVGTHAHGLADKAVVQNVDDMAGTHIDFANGDNLVDVLQFKTAGVITLSDLQFVTGVETITLSSKGPSSITIPDSVAESADGQTLTIKEHGGSTIDLNNITGGETVNVELAHLASSVVNLGTDSSFAANVKLGAAGQTVLGQSSGLETTVSATVDELFNGKVGSTLVGNGNSTLEVTIGGSASTTVDTSTFELTGFGNIIATDSGGQGLTLNLATLSEDENVTFLGNSANTLIAGQGHYSVTATGSGSQDIDLRQAFSGSQAVTGSGADVIFMNAFGQTVATGAGNDSVFIDVNDDGGDISSTINAGPNTAHGVDTLYVVGGGDGQVVTLESGVLGFEVIDLTNSGNVDLRVNVQAYQNIITGVDGATIELSNPETGVVGNVADHVTGNIGDDTVITSAAYLSAGQFTFHGGGGNDAIQLVSSGDFTLAGGRVENNGGTLTLELAGGANDVTLTTQQNVFVEGGGSSDTVHLGQTNGATVSDFPGGAMTVFMDHTHNSTIVGNGNTNVELDSQVQVVGANNTFTGDFGASNTFDINGGGNYNLQAASNPIVGFDVININSASAVTLLLDNNNIYNGTGWFVDLGTNSGTTVHANAASDGNTFLFHADGQTVTGSRGSDVYELTADLLGGVHINEQAGGFGVDTVRIYAPGASGTSFALNSGIANIEKYQVDFAAQVTDNLTSGQGSYELDLSTGDDTLIVSGSQLFNGVVLNGGGSGYDGFFDTVGDTLEISGGGTIALTGAQVYDVVNFQTITLDAATQLTVDDSVGVHTINGSNGGDIINASALTTGVTVNAGSGNDHITTGSGGDLVSSGGGTDIISTGAGNDTIVLQGGSAGSVDGGSGSNTVSVSAAGAVGGTVDLSNETFTNIQTLSFGAAGLNVVVDSTKLGSINAITGNIGGGDTLTAVQNLDLTTIALSDVATVAFGATAAGALVASAATLAAEGVANIEGGAGTTDTWIVTDAAGLNVNLAPFNLTGTETLSLSGGNHVVIVNDHTLDGVTNILDTGSGDTLILSDTSTTLSLIHTNLNGKFGAITLGSLSDTGTNTLVVGDTSLAGITNINGGTHTTDVIELGDTGTNLNLSGVTLSSIEGVVLGDSLDASGNTLEISAANLAGLTSIVGSSAANDTIVFTNGIGTVDLVAHGASNIDTLDVTATGTINAVLSVNNGHGMTINSTLTDIDTGGGGANVQITGTAFSDSFVFTDAHDGGAGANAVSTINGFQSVNQFPVGIADHIDLSGLITAEGLGTFWGGDVTSSGVDAALDATHSVVYNTSTQTLIIDLDHNGVFDPNHDLQIHLPGVATLAQADVIL